MWFTTRQWVLNWDTCSICQPDNCDTGFFSIELLLYTSHCRRWSSHLFWAHFCSVFWILVVLAHSGGPVGASCPRKWVVFFKSIAHQLFWTCSLILLSDFFSTRVSNAIILLLFKVLFFVAILLVPFYITFSYKQIHTLVNSLLLSCFYYAFI